MEEGLVGGGRSCCKASAGANGISLANGVATCSGWASGVDGASKRNEVFIAEGVRHELGGRAQSVKRWSRNRENLSLIPRACMSKTKPQLPGLVAQAFIWAWKRQMHFCEFGASLGYIMSSRPARATKGQKQQQLQTRTLDMFVILYWGGRNWYLPGAHYQPD